MSTDLPTSLQERISHIVTSCETRKQAIIPVFKAIQTYRGYIADQDITFLEKQYEIPATRSLEVLTFYTMLRKTPGAAVRFQVCKGISCVLAGSKEVTLALKKHAEQMKSLGQPLNFEVEEVACLGVCGSAPVVIIGEERHLSVTPALALQLLKNHEEGVLKK